MPERNKDQDISNELRNKFPLDYSKSLRSTSMEGTIIPDIEHPEAAVQSNPPLFDANELAASYFYLQSCLPESMAEHVKKAFVAGFYKCKWLHTPYLLPALIAEEFKRPSPTPIVEGVSKEDWNEVKDLLKKCKYALEYAAYNYDGAKLENLPLTMVESTGVSDSALLAARDIEQFLETIPSRLRATSFNAEASRREYFKETGDEDILIDNQNLTNYALWLEKRYALQFTTPTKEDDADSISIDELFSAFKRYGIDTTNFDGDEGAEQAIALGVKNLLAEQSYKEAGTDAVAFSLEDLKKAWGAFRMRGFPHNTDSFGNETFEQFHNSLNKQ